MTTSTPNLSPRRRTKAADPSPRLSEQLVLRDFLATQLGYPGPQSISKLMADLADKSGERQANGQSSFLPILLARPKIPMREDLPRMDKNVMAHEQELRRHRPGFRLLYFQYLAALFTEAYLTLWARNEAQLLNDLNAFLLAGKKLYRDLPPFTGDDLRTLAFWMATGAGKTLLMHLALRQFDHYAQIGEGTGKRIFTPDARILVTPGINLSKQHLEEFAKSGIEARLLGDIPPGFTGIQVMEITKLRSDNDTPRGKVVTVSVAEFAGANLVLVDEGHKGAATASDLREENRWRTLRNELAGRSGFTLEYSATFAQVTESDKSGSLRHAYAHAVAFEYAYGRFYNDGYGKDFQVLNVKSATDLVLTERVLLTSLLTLLQKQIGYHNNTQMVREYHLFPPLMVFVGATVNGKEEESDIPVVLRFLHRLLSDPQWGKLEIEILLSGQGGLQDGNGRDALTGSFGMLKNAGRTAQDIYEELKENVFHGGGGLRLQPLRRQADEIALWASSARQPFGVVKVGDPSGLLSNLGTGHTITVSEEDPLMSSLFDGINAPTSSINVLIGSKIFAEGWSSWRVSVMGLLHVGQNAGAQVMQLFGRGVRLLGKGTGLQRSAVLDGPHPKELAFQETLNLFGVKANYLQVLLDALDKDGIKPVYQRELPIIVRSEWQEAIHGRGLLIPTVDESYEFKSETLVFRAKSLPKLTLNLTAGIEVGQGAEIETGRLTTITRSLGGDTKGSDKQTAEEAIWPFISTAGVLEAVSRHKHEKNWSNLYLPAEEVLQAVKQTVVTARTDFFSPRSFEALRTLQSAAEAAAVQAIEKFFKDEEQRGETARMRPIPLTTAHPNFPKGQEFPFAYTLKVPEHQLAQVEALIADAAQLLEDADTEPLPRLNIDRHLYEPLLTEHTNKINLEIQVNPPRLVDSERQFIIHLQSWWTGNHSQPTWEKTEIWLLRNLSKSGVGFFRSAGFYPDFLLWIKEGEKQALAFVDPKGVRQMGLDDEKFSLHLVLESRRQQFGFHTTSFILAKELQNAPLTSGRTLQELAEKYHILNQDEAGDYVDTLMMMLKADI